MKTSVNLDNPHIVAAFANWSKMVIELISPKDLIVISGRGTAKTTSIQAGRFIDISHDMNHAYFAWCVTTYMDAMDNIVPTLIEGLQRHGWQEGKHFVTDQPPPPHFLKPYKAPKSYKHTISTYLGTFTQIVSTHEISAAAGGSYQHLFADELKNIVEKKIKKLFPALRGGEYIRFSRSPYYMGRTFTTDMPNITEGEHDWFLEQEKNMNREQMQKILEIGLVLNDIRIEYVDLYTKAMEAKVKGRKGDYNKYAHLINKCTEKLVKWKGYWYRARKNSTLFLVGSTFANLDVLTLQYFKEVLKAEGMNSFATTIISLKPSIKKGERFYMNLAEFHFFDDGVRKEFYDGYKLTQRVAPTSEALRYCDLNAKLEAGVDFGYMCSMVTGQPRGNYMYLLRNFYTLAPEEAPHLANKFKEFYRNHKMKVLDLYYDRAGNQMNKVNRDWASDLKYQIEHDENGNPTGWVVNLMSLNQATIYQEEEYLFMVKLLGETVEGLPKVRIDRLQNKELKSSLELTKTVVSKDRRTGSNRIGKDKSSEKLPLAQLPLFSTNFSDAFKYLMCRNEWMAMAGRREIYVG